MWLRSIFVSEEGLNPISGVIFGIVMIFVACYSGKVYFETKDVL